MNTREATQRNWIRWLTLVVPLVAISLVAPLSGCSGKSKDGALVNRDRPLYRPIRSELSKQLAEMERKTAEKYKDTGSRAFAKEMERRYKSGRRVTEVGMSRPGMSAEDQKAWDALNNRGG